VTCHQSGFKGDDVTRDPNIERLYDQVETLGRQDARAGVDPRELTGELADLTDEYLDAYTQELCVMVGERAVN
jgi:hypothetical protein